MTMREKIIAALRAKIVGDAGWTQEVHTETTDAQGAVVDMVSDPTRITVDGEVDLEACVAAMLDVLMEPTDGMIITGNALDGAANNARAKLHFTAMIRAAKEGK